MLNVVVFELSLATHGSFTLSTLPLINALSHANTVSPSSVKCLPIKPLPILAGNEFGLSLRLNYSSSVCIVKFNAYGPIPNLPEINIFIKFLSSS